MRERRFLELEFETFGGITPACAGTTVTAEDVRAAMEDHPRLCGNDTEKDLKLAEMLGSPPLVRERREQRGIDQAD